MELFNGLLLSPVEEGYSDSHKLLTSYASAPVDGSYSNSHRLLTSNASAPVILTTKERDEKSSNGQFYEVTYERQNQTSFEETREEICQQSNRGVFERTRSEIDVIEPSEVLERTRKETIVIQSSEISERTRRETIVIESTENGTLKKTNVQTYKFDVHESCNEANKRIDGKSRDNYTEDYVEDPLRSESMTPDTVDMATELSRYTESLSSDDVIEKDNVVGSVSCVIDEDVCSIEADNVVGSVSCSFTIEEDACSIEHRDNTGRASLKNAVSLPILSSQFIKSDHSEHPYTTRY